MTQQLILEKLFKDHHKELTNYAGRLMNPRLQSRMTPEEVVQEAYASALTDRRFYSPLATHIAIMKQVVERKVIDAFRFNFNLKRGLQFELIDDEHAMQLERPNGLSKPITTPSMIAIRHENEEALRVALLGLAERGELDSTEIAIIQERHMKGTLKTIQEIATDLNMPYVEAHSKYTKALKQLAKVLRGYGV